MLRSKSDRNSAGTFAGSPHTRLFGTDGDKLHSRHQFLWSGFGPIPHAMPNPIPPRPEKAHRAYRRRDPVSLASNARFWYKAEDLRCGGDSFRFLRCFCRPYGAVGMPHHTSTRASITCACRNATLCTLWMRWSRRAQYFATANSLLGTRTPTG